MTALIFFIIGACFGSFANVCIYRMPRSKSIAAPASFCPKCKTPIRAFDNIPILSWFLLFGKCRKCGGKIALRYPVVEALMGLLSLAIYLKFGLAAAVIPYCVFALALLIVSFIDLETFLIPDSIVLPGIGAGILCAAVIPDFFFTLGKGSVFYSLFGALTGAVLVAALAFLGKLVWKKDAMGGGDLKLLAMIGAFLGWKSVFITMFFASVLGTIISVVLILLKKKKMDDYVPFGPYLGLGALIALFYKGYTFLGFFVP
jgi:leader peptidase (prepilin peptidase)/N-methyltransferase